MYLMKQYAVNSFPVHTARFVKQDVNKFKTVCSIFTDRFFMQNNVQFTYNIIVG